MRCRTAEKGLSDDLDGALGPRKRTRLEAHLRACPACRAGRDALARLNEATGPSAELSDEYWSGFERRLAARLDREPAGRKAAARPFPARPRLAWAAAGFVILAALAAVWFAARRPQPDLTAWLAEGELFGPMLLEAEADPAFERAAEGEIRVSLEALSPGPDADAAALAVADPLFWEGLSDEELEAIVAGMERESGVGGPK